MSTASRDQLIIVCIPNSQKTFRFSIYLIGKRLLFCLESTISQKLWSRFIFLQVNSWRTRFVSICTFCMADRRSKMAAWVTPKRSAIFLSLEFILVQKCLHIKILTLLEQSRAFGRSDQNCNLWTAEANLRMFFYNKLFLRAFIGIRWYLAINLFKLK